MIRCLVYPLAAAVLGSCASAPAENPSLPPPPVQMEAQAPADIVTVSAGAKTSYLPPDQLRAASQYSAARRGLSFLVIQHGKTLWEDYPNGSSRGEPHKIFSGTKAFWNLAALKAQEDGLLDLDERVGDTIPSWREDSRRSRVTIRQLLDFTAGLDPMFHLHSDGLSDRDSMAVNARMVSSPGSDFLYGPSCLQVFHEILKHKLARRGESPTHYLERKVLGPLDLGPQRYVADHSGNPLCASGFKLTAREWSRVGELLLNQGSPVISPTSYQNFRSGTSANRAFAFGLWNNTNAARSGAREPDIEDTLELDWQRENWHGVCLCRDAPSDLIASVGSGYQRLYVIPSMDLIIVRQGTNAKFSDGQFLRILLGR